MSQQKGCHFSFSNFTILLVKIIKLSIKYKNCGAYSALIEEKDQGLCQAYASEIYLSRTGYLEKK